MLNQKLLSTEDLSKRNLQSHALVSVSRVATPARLNYHQPVPHEQKSSTSGKSRIIIHRTIRSSDSTSRSIQNKAINSNVDAYSISTILPARDRQNTVNHSDVNINSTEHVQNVSPSLSYNGCLCNFVQCRCAWALCCPCLLLSLLTAILLSTVIAAVLAGIFIKSKTTTSTSTSDVTTTTISTTLTTTTETTTTSTACTTPASTALSYNATTSVYTLTTYNYTASYTGFAVLEFGFRGQTGNDYWYLDDVSLVDTNTFNSEMLVNGNFENGTTDGWQLLCSSNCQSAAGAIAYNTSCYTGLFCYTDGCKSGFDFLRQAFSMKIGHVYTLSFWIRTDTKPQQYGFVRFF
ncbi:unnamed protein product [Adineta steineri]|uniref:Uncharacterized protein n=1 Tax=Adineta steineri TaxID=433720 RepID=A0A814VZ11_9BILA|nr:unnamed protein product [Adineta steineri]CAF1557501.1 unnamed protein product [Adineta steineri]